MGEWKGVSQCGSHKSILVTDLSRGRQRLHERTSALSCGPINHCSLLIDCLLTSQIGHFGGNYLSINEAIHTHFFYCGMSTHLIFLLCCPTNVSLIVVPVCTGQPLYSYCICDASMGCCRSTDGRPAAYHTLIGHWLGQQRMNSAPPPPPQQTSIDFVLPPKYCHHQPRWESNSRIP